MKSLVVLLALAQCSTTARDLGRAAIVYAGYHSPNLANLLPNNTSTARWHADPLTMDSESPFDGTSFFFSPSEDVREQLNGQCCYECCLQWSCCMGYRLTVDEHQWDNSSTTLVAALNQQAAKIGRISSEWTHLKRNSIWIQLVSQETFSRARASTAWWFDDDRFATVAFNWATAAAAAHRSGATQLFIDAEEYCEWCPPGVEPPNCREASNLDQIANCSLFYYPDLAAFRNSSFVEFEAAARQRGRQLLRATVEVWPTLEEICLTKGFGSTFASFRWLPGGGDRDANLTRSEYSLLPAFLDGLLIGINETQAEVTAASAKPAPAQSWRRQPIPAIVLTEQYEDYFLHTRTDFQRAFSLAKSGAATLSRHPDLVQRFYRVGFGLSLDQKRLADGTVTSTWNTTNFTENNFTPDSLETALRVAFDLADAPTAVWVWGTLLVPWVPTTESPMGLPIEYAQAIRAAKQLRKQIQVT